MFKQNVYTFIVKTLLFCSSLQICLKNDRFKIKAINNVVNGGSIDTVTKSPQVSLQQGKMGPLQ